MLAALVVAAALLGAVSQVNAQQEIVVDDSNTTAILYEPRASWNHWTASSDTFAPGINANDTLSVPLQTVTNATVTFNFTGIGFAYYGTTHPDTKTCNLTIDSQSHQLSLQSPDKATHYGQLIFSLQGLPDGHHTVVIQQVLGAKSSLFEIDRFIYTSRGGTASVDSVPTSPDHSTGAPTPTSDPSPPSSGSSGPNPGIIAGGVISGIIVLAAALGIFWWLRRLDALDPKPKNSRPTSGIAAHSNRSNPSGFNSSRPVSFNPANLLHDRSASSLSKPTTSSRLNSPTPVSGSSGSRPDFLPPLKSLSELSGQRDAPIPGPSSPRRAGKSSSTGGSFGTSHNRSGSAEHGGSSHGRSGSATDRPESSAGSRMASSPEPVAGPSKSGFTPEPIIVIPAAKLNRESTASEPFEYPYEYAQYLLATPRSDTHRISAASSSSGRPLLPPASPTSSSSRVASPTPGRVVSPTPQWQGPSSGTDANPPSVSPLPSSRTIRIASPLPLQPIPNTRVASPPLRNTTASPPLTNRPGTPPIHTTTPISYPVVQATPVTLAGATTHAPSPLPSRPRSNSQTLRLNMTGGGNRVSRSNSLSGVGTNIRSSPSPVQDPNAPLSHQRVQHPFAYPDRSGSSPPSPARENFAKQYGW